MIEMCLLTISKKYNLKYYKKKKEKKKREKKIPHALDIQMG
jgi:hypothetical protein